MKVGKLSLVVLFFLGAPLAVAQDELQTEMIEGAAASLDLSACAFPDAPAVPDGNTATHDQMTSAGAAVREFVANGEAQLGCLDDLRRSLGETVTEAQTTQIISAHNAGVDKLNEVAGAYNAAVKAYNAANPQ